MLITLFEIKMVANSILGDSISSNIILCFFNLDSFKQFLSDGDKAKKAISDPDTKPDPTNRKRHDRNGVKKL